jgi:hypothetical protein
MDKDTSKQLEAAIMFFLEHRLSTDPHARTKALIAEAESMHITDADMDVTIASLVLDKFRLNK